MTYIYMYICICEFMCVDILTRTRTRPSNHLRLQKNHLRLQKNHLRLFTPNLACHRSQNALKPSIFPRTGVQTTCDYFFCLPKAMKSLVTTRTWPPPDKNHLRLETLLLLKTLLLSFRLFQHPSPFRVEAFDTPMSF